MSPVLGTTAPRRGLWRSGLYGLKPAFVARLGRIEDVLFRRGTSADAVTLAALVVAGATAAALIGGLHNPLLWLAVGPLCLLRMAANALDGSLARRRGSSSPRGAVLNELTDRGADVVTFAALAPIVGGSLAMTVVLVALATSFTAVVAQASVGARIGVGPLGKPDRVALLSVAAAVGAFAGKGALVAGAWAIVALGTITIARRIRVLWQRAGDAA